jgi:hypothetical protein
MITSVSILPFSSGNDDLGAVWEDVVWRGGVCEVWKDEVWGFLGVKIWEGAVEGAQVSS